MKKKFLSILLSVGMIFGLSPMVAFANDLEENQNENLIIQDKNDFYDVAEKENNLDKTEKEENKTSLESILDTDYGVPEIIANIEDESEYGSDDPTGKHGLFGYAMSLDPSVSKTYFPGTANWTFNQQGIIGDQDIEYYADAQSGWWKYYIYNKYFTRGDLASINIIAPFATEKNVDFLFWYQKDVSNPERASGINNGQSFYMPGEVIYYDGGDGTAGRVPDNFPVYSVDAVWSIWTSKDKIKVYNGQPQLPSMSYTYSYDSFKGANFSSDLQEQLEELATLEIMSNGKNIYIPTEEDQTWSPEVSEEIVLNKGSQVNVGTYQYNYKVDYRRDADQKIIGSTDDSAQLIIKPRPVKITGIQTRQFTGENITIDFNENQFASWTETSEDAGVVAEQNIHFNIPVSGLAPGTYSVDIDNNNVTITDKDGLDVTKNYIIDGQVTLVIEGSPTLTIGKEVNIPTGLNKFYDANGNANDTFDFQVTIAGKPVIYKLQAGETKEINVPFGSIYSVEEISDLTGTNYTIGGITVNDGELTKNINHMMGRMTNNMKVIITNDWHPFVIPNPTPLPEVTPKANLVITKNVTYTNLLPSANDAFSFKVIVGDNYEEIITLKNGESWSKEFDEGLAYSIEEINIPKGYTFVESNNNNIVSDNIKVDGITTSVDIVVRYTNKYWELNIGDFPNTDVYFGSLTIQKTVETNLQYLYDHWNKQEDIFTFNVKIGDENKMILLKANESYTIKDIPVNTEYSIEEVNLPQGYTLTSDNNITGTITKENDSHSVSFVNTWTYVPGVGDLPNFGQEEEKNPEPIPPVLEPVEIFGTLTIKKEVNTELEYLYNYWNKKDDIFSFEVTINDKTENISLKAGESYTFKDIPAKSEYFVKEINIPSEYVLSSDNNIKGTITWENKDQNITFVNKWSYVPEIGPFPGFEVEPDQKPDIPDDTEKPKPPKEEGQDESDDQTTPQEKPNDSKEQTVISDKKQSKAQETKITTLPQTGDDNSFIYVIGIVMFIAIIAGICALIFDRRKIDTK